MQMMVASRNIAVSLASLLLLLLLTNPVLAASDRSFEITSVDIQARIDAEGNMQVTEQDTYRFHGAFNGVIVQLDSSSSDGIRDFQAYEIKEQQEIPLTFDKSGKGSRVQYKVFDQANEETKIFKFIYEYKNVVQVYEDTAELYWKFFDHTNPSDLGMVRIRVDLPGGVMKDDILAYGHGPLLGTVNITQDGSLEYQVSPLLAGQMLEARVLFPQIYVPDSTKIKNTPMLDQIKQEELKWAEDADSKRATNRNPLPRALVYAIAVIVFNLGLIVFLYFKYDKERKPDWHGAYYRELPADVTPAVVSYLMDFKIQTRDVLATLIDLVRKKHVEIQVVKETGGFLRKEKTDYRFKLIDERTNGLKQHEAFLLHWFFNQLGLDNEVSLSDLHQYVKKKANARIFTRQLADWKATATKEAKQMGYFETSNPGLKIAVIAFAAQFIALLFLVPAEYNWLAFLTIPLFLYGLKIKRRTKTGATERAKWRAFQRFLADYSRMESSEPMAVHLWEHYFVYAIPLGVAKKMIAIANIDIRHAGYGNDTVYGMVADTGFYRHFEHFSESFDKTISAAQSNASSRGSGGGFSSGGGGGGGGGGRGAF
ncbi:DUF2207 domain-containing protein [Paenibacillus sp. KQZ6P-2]|uniref:DUF2207 domain-containing protein n=1 Tax=Paenibacillus mangrovi TaxID=2931978 RepID=A0A9X2B1J3_9BACL|nr:DUF2207 domain-containing protein [Paenibacillus mangrovi]MCJ8011594.1 DUF2207 domain-containing protein [Paenibacillus mangrovi]